jgi:hypothetical protein
MGDEGITNIENANFQRIIDKISKTNKELVFNMLQGFENEKPRTPRKINTGSFFNYSDLNVSQLTDREKYEIMLQNGEDAAEHQIS